LSGSKEVEPISFYNKKGRVFSNNGRYYEAAFGDRIFGSYNLIESAKKLLVSDSTSRRALIPLFIPDDLIKLPNDTPCASSIQVMIRDNKIDFFLHMRSQSVVMIFPYDIFLFSMLHEYLSLALNKSPGTFNYYANSFHYYVEEEDTLNAIISEKAFTPQPMDVMPTSTLDEIESIIQFEEKVRNNILLNKNVDNEPPISVSNYWQDLLSLLYAKALSENDLAYTGYKSKYLEFDKLYI